MTDNAISIAGLTKRFGATTALSQASFTVRRGTTHAILGENGAGKSTLIKILSGMLQADEGSFQLFGEVVHFKEPGQAQAAGVATAFQELSMVPDMTVAENLCLPDPPTRLGLIQHGERTRKARSILLRFGVHDIDVSRTVKELDLSLRQKLEIVHAMSRNPKVLLLDEPTSALASKDVQWLGKQIEFCRCAGTTILLITHRMPEVRAFCEDMSILRNGSFVGTFREDEIDDQEVFRLIMGRSVGSTFPQRRPVPPDAENVLVGQHLTSGHRLNDVSFVLRKGECLGVVALQGMGQLELFYGLFGLEPFDRGRIEVGDQPVAIGSPLDAVRAEIGLSLVPEERKTEGLALELSGRINISLPTINRFACWGWIDQERERAAVARVLEQVKGNPRAMVEPASAFSGGNQQKLVIAKWLLSESRAMLLFDPTRGVDVGAKHEIYEMMDEYTRSGGAILLHSTEIPEVVNLCHRVIVLYEGRVVAEFQGTDLLEESVTTAMLGGEVAPSRAVEGVMEA